MEKKEEKAGKRGREMNFKRRQKKQPAEQGRNAEKEEDAGSDRLRIVKEKRRFTLISFKL